MASSNEMQDIIDKFFTKFPKVYDYVQRCHEAVRDPGYVENAFGRRRYFFPTDNEQLMKAQEREAQNSNVQSTVADALNLALINLVYYRQMENLKYKIILPVHDAIILDTPLDEVDLVQSEVFPFCMTHAILIPGTTLHLDTDIEISRRWGEKIKKDEALEEARQELLAVK